VEGVEETHPMESNKDSSTIEIEKNGSTFETIKKVYNNDESKENDSTLETIKTIYSNDESKENDSTLETIRETYGNDEIKDNESTLQTIRETYGIEEKSPLLPPIEGEELQNKGDSFNIEDSNEEQVKNIASILPKVDCEYESKNKLLEESIQPSPILKSPTSNINNTCGWFLSYLY